MAVFQQNVGTGQENIVKRCTFEILYENGLKGLHFVFLLFLVLCSDKSGVCEFVERDLFAGNHLPAIS